MDEQEANTVNSDDHPPMLPITSALTLQRCMNFPNLANGLDSIFIASYPKSGTTWTQAIVYHLLTSGENKLDHISSFTPFFEIDKTWDDQSGNIREDVRQNHQLIGRNVFNTHLLWHIMPKGSNMKYIYLMRHPYDVVVSFYHHLTNQADSGGYEKSFKEFLDDWLTGKIIFGKWVSHLKSWMTCNHENVLFVKYEDLKLHLEESLMKIASFLGLNPSAEVIAMVASLVNFEAMKRNKHQYQPVSVAWKEGFDFLRKGEIGDGRSSLIGEEEEILIKIMLDQEFPLGFPSWFPYSSI
jgi:hypothetical protein